MKQVNLLSQTGRTRPKMLLLRGSQVHIALGVLCGLWAVGIAAHWWSAHHGLDLVRKKLQRAHASSAETRRMQEACKALERYQRALRDAERGVPADAVLSIISAQTFDGVSFATLGMRSATAKKSGAKGAGSDHGVSMMMVSLTGDADSGADIARLLSSLTESSFISNVTTRPVESSKGREMFSLSMEIRGAEVAARGGSR